MRKLISVLLILLLLCGCHGGQVSDSFEVPDTFDENKRKDVITNISTDTTPNVCITYPAHIATYLTGNNVVVPLDDLYTDDKYGLGGSELKFDSPSIDEMVDKFVEEGKIGDNYYALHFIRTTEVSNVNKTYESKMR